MTVPPADDAAGRDNVPRPSATAVRRADRPSARGPLGSSLTSDLGGSALVLSRRDGGEGPHGRSISFHAAA